MKKFLSSFLSNHQTIFLIDGIGAVLTCILLSFVLAPLETYFGLPANVLHSLSLIGLCFALYSFGCHFAKFTKWWIFLRAIALANLFYCFVTISLLFTFRDVMTTLGILYFLCEIVVICVLVYFEWKLSFRKN